MINAKLAAIALGRVSYRLGNKEKKNRMFRRSLFVVKNIKKGEIFTEDNIKSIRPAMGMKPKYLNKILGKKARKNIKIGTPVRLNYGY